MPRRSKLVLVAIVLLIVDLLFLGMSDSYNGFATAPGVAAYVFFLPSLIVVGTLFTILKIPNEVSYMPYVAGVQFLLLMLLANWFLSRKRRRVDASRAKSRLN